MNDLANLSMDRRHCFAKPGDFWHLGLDCVWRWPTTIVPALLAGARTWWVRPHSLRSRAVFGRFARDVCGGDEDGDHAMTFPVRPIGIWQIRVSIYPAGRTQRFFGCHVAAGCSFQSSEIYRFIGVSLLSAWRRPPRRTCNSQIGECSHCRHGSDPAPVLNRWR